MNIELLQGDCLELMKEIPDGSVDMVLCDLPYGVTECSWDKVIPIPALFEQYFRVVKPQGAILLFGQEPFASQLRMANIKQYKYDWYWEKTKKVGYVHAKNKPMYACEVISVFSKAPIGHRSKLGDRRMIYNPQGVTSDGEKTVSGRNKVHVIGARPNQVGRVYEAQKGFPNNVLKYKSVGGERKHPTQKPVALLEYLIKTYTNEGETVLDNCMGSGSTGVAAINCNRNFIGMELDPGYFQIAKERIEKAQIEKSELLELV